LNRLAQIYVEEPEKVAKASTDLAQSIRDNLAPTPAPESVAAPDARIVHGAAMLYERIFDPEQGGVQRAPKFPSSMPVRFLLRHHRRTATPRRSTWRRSRSR
jgi:uncharacterized protein YyaL (SSP411 family)